MPDVEPKDKFVTSPRSSSLHHSLTQTQPLLHSLTHSLHHNQNHSHNSTPLHINKWNFIRWTISNRNRRISEIIEKLTKNVTISNNTWTMAQQFHYRTEIKLSKVQFGTDCANKQQTKLKSAFTPGTTLKVMYCSRNLRSHTAISQ